jgi:hypothetical protein
MDWSAWTLSLQLAAATTLLLLPLAVLIARPLLTMRPGPRLLTEGLVALPLVLPPTVLGFYLLVAFGQQSFLGEFYRGPHRAQPGVQLRRPARRLASSSTCPSPCSRCSARWKPSRARCAKRPGAAA